MNGHDIIVVGASAGGVEALSDFVADLPVTLPAAVFVVVHIPPNAPSVLASILTRRGLIAAVTASDGLRIQNGRIYVAPPDHHLLIRAGSVRVVRGPRENGHRPAIDPLFRTAAYVYGARVVGVVMSGTLDDGAAGLVAVERAGGVALVQEPDEALYSDMPRAALAAVPGARPLRVRDLARAVTELAEDPVEQGPEQGGAAGVRGPEQTMEAQMSELKPEAVHADERPGEPSGLGCPECGGALYEFREGELIRFRCRVGHAYAPESLLNGQRDNVEAALWTALRALEESAALCQRLAKRAQGRGDEQGAERYIQRADDSVRHAETIRRLILRSSGGSGGDEGTTATQGSG